MGSSGELHIVKECQEYKGQAGDHCTITSSNIGQIDDGSRVVYASAAADGSLDSDIVLESGGGSRANGPVKLDLGAGKGSITFSGGTGKLAGFNASAEVSADADGLWHWDGTYSLDPTPATVA
jgi:hypothetical protein